jgi:hypothetical protein
MWGFMGAYGSLMLYTAIDGALLFEPGIASDAVMDARAGLVGKSTAWWEDAVLGKASKSSQTVKAGTKFYSLQCSALERRRDALRPGEDNNGSPE